MSPGTRGNGRWALAGWTTLVVAFVGDVGPIGRAFGLGCGAIAFGTFALLSRRSLSRSVALAVAAAALVAPTMIWLAQSLVGEFVPLETPILATCLNLTLAMAAGFVSSRAAWSTGLALAICIVAGLYVDERLCVPLYVGTMLVGCAAFGGATIRAPIGARIAVFATIAATCCSAAWLIDDERHVGGRGGLVPTSGGTGAGSIRATMGVGDGPDVVNATRSGARTIGFDQSDVFVNSEHAGLYDAFIESFGEPAKASQVKKMIGLKREQIITSAEQAELDLRRGKTFSMLRSPPLPAKPADGASANAVLWIDSDRSQHVPLRTYDHFDGGVWRQVAQSDVKASLHNVDEPQWMVRVDRPYSEAIGQPVTTTIVTGRFDDDVVPMPALSTAFKLGRVDRTDFFRAAQPNLIRLRDRTVPAGTIVDARHCLLRADWIERSVPAVHPGRAPVLSDEPDAPVDSFVRRATAGRASGWPQVLAMLVAVRASGRFDDGAASADGAPLDAFLARRVGASYDFASLFALGLDDLGYDARLVAGFYADAGVRDPRSAQIVVRPTDAHFWCEMRLADGTWIPVDPTPGFDVDVERPSRLALAWAATVAGIVRHASAIATACAALAVIAARWRRLADAAITIAWRTRLSVHAGGGFGQTARLLDRRARLADAARPASHTFGRWLCDQAIAVTHAATVESFREGLDRELYARSPRSIRVGDRDTMIAIARESTYAALRRTRRLDTGASR